MGIRRRWSGLTIEPVVALVVVLVLHPFDLVGRAPLVLTVLPMVLFGVLQHPVLVTRRLTPYLHLLAAGWIVYVTGWGPVLPLAFALVVTYYVRDFGARLWRPMAVGTAVCIGLGQLGIALGWVFTYLPPTPAQATGLLGLLLTVLFIRALGHSAEEREQAEASVRDTAALYQALVQDSTDVYCVVEATGEMRYVSPAIRNLTGFGAEAYAGANWTTQVDPDGVVLARAAIERCLADPAEPQAVQLRARHAGGGWRWVEGTVRNLIAHPAVGALVVNFRDVTERVEMQERLTHEATYDHLTGLHNRAAFLRGLAAAPLTAGVAVLFVDLDGFKAVNDTYGHRYGDALLASVAGVLRSCVRPEDLLGRLGGDEFGVVLASGSPLTVAGRILAALDQPVTVDGVTLRARASIGVAAADPSCGSAAELLDRADLAMYDAKRAGTHGVHVYELQAADR
ncbi:sensor domain-containing diguanylate cyclase [Actinoplanes sp. NPDC049596]|uniref:sensor domain-containing diguanylate cyclase n=1 Tax=unclassified Actinoplanes TaxID=2626549 RepID=UPI0034481DA1